jgi:putative colanic acid biosynthesis acetyltransferase WcaF
MHAPADLRSVTGGSPDASSDPFLRPQTSLRNRLARAVWGVVCLLLFRPSPRPLHAWRAMLLRCFGAKLGANCHIYPGARIWAPWNLVCEDVVGIADEAIVYNPARIEIGSHAVISQQAYLCGATHNLHDPTFPFVAKPIRIGRLAWICARATVLPGITVGDGAVVALGGVATRDLEPWTVYGGIPATRLGNRQRQK